MANRASPCPVLFGLFIRASQLVEVNDKGAGIYKAVLERGSAILWQLSKPAMTVRVGEDWITTNEIHVNCAVTEGNVQNSRADFGGKFLKKCAVRLHSCECDRLGWIWGQQPARLSNMGSW
ncbi:hypothetical protein FOZG_06584 [Fusarium oxysporum Fo47]|uniref:Uncharacterized protein n=1 Tax=Fusarium oxysporum Fo47 TaxID=660027 RepID=W9KIR7_FUSOX|nr:hypothetical protein FOZG_06584 [Fusarium oxysporum Fo47]